MSNQTLLPPELTAIGYRVPESPSLVQLDIVTPTCNRPLELIRHARLLAAQLYRQDRLIVVDDASRHNHATVARDIARLLAFPGEQFLSVALSYCREGQAGTVNRARHAGCSLARPGAWIVEMDDHDLIAPKALEYIRHAVCRGAAFVYGDCEHISADGASLGVYEKPDYLPYLLRDCTCPGEGVRAFPKILYEAVGGYRWHGELQPGGNEFPAGDYGLFVRMELLCGGRGFFRLPAVLARTVKAADTISGRFGAEQAAMAERLRQHAQTHGRLP